MEKESVFHLQSANYPLEADGRGLHIDLNQGYIHAKKNFTLETEGFKVDTDPTKIEFLISDPGESKSKLFSIYYDGNSSLTEYFLQSRYFDELQYREKGDPYPDGVEGGIRLDLHNGKFEAVGGFSFTADNFELNANPDDSTPYFAIYDSCTP